MKLIRKIVALTVILCMLGAFNTFIVTESYNEHTMYASHIHKMNRALGIEENKFIVIGGSATNLGLNSQKFEELSGSPTSNLSISAGVPLRTYMRSAEKCANPGDTIFMALEYAYYERDFYDVDEVYVDMVSIDSDLKCSEKGRGLVDYPCTKFLRGFTRFNDVFMFKLKNLLQTENSIYIKDSVDEYGDFCLHQNHTPTYNRVTEEKEFTYNTETLEIISSYISEMKKSGVTVYLTYPPIDGYSYSNYQQYFSEAQKAIEKYIPEENIIGTPFDFIYDKDFFFDTLYHVKYENRDIYTKALYEAYLKAQSNQK